MGTKKKKAKRVPSPKKQTEGLVGEAAVEALLKAKMHTPGVGSGWSAGVPKLRELVRTGVVEQAALESSIESALVASKRMTTIAPNFGAKPEEVRITISEAAQAFGLPLRPIRDGLINGLIGGHNFFGRTGWLTTVPDIRAFLKGVHTPGLVTRLEERVKELEAELAAAKKAAKKAA